MKNLGRNKPITVHLDRSGSSWASKGFILRVLGLRIAKFEYLGTDQARKASFRKIRDHLGLLGFIFIDLGPNEWIFRGKAIIT